MQDGMGHDAGRWTERAGPERAVTIGDGIELEFSDPVDALLEAHATIVAEIRVRAAQPDLDGREIVVLAKALTALEVAMDVVADGAVAPLPTYRRHAGS